MEVHPPSTENAILQHHVTTVAVKKQKNFAFVFCSSIEIQPMKRLAPAKGNKEEGVQGFLFSQQSAGRWSQVCYSNFLINKKKYLDFRITSGPLESIPV